VGKKNSTSFQAGRKKTGGMTKTSPEIKGIKAYTAYELEMLITAMFEMTFNEVSRILEDPASPMLKRIMAQALLSGHSDGDMRQVNNILDRVIGKVREVIKVEGFEPTVLVKRDGTKLEFTNKPKDSDK
jgi:hypothetical protein